MFGAHGGRTSVAGQSGTPCENVLRLLGKESGSTSHRLAPTKGPFWTSVWHTFLFFFLFSFPYKIATFFFDTRFSLARQAPEKKTRLCVFGFENRLFFSPFFLFTSLFFFAASEALVAVTRTEHLRLRR